MNLIPMVWSAGTVALIAIKFAKETRSESEDMSVYNEKK